MQSRLWSSCFVRKQFPKSVKWVGATRSTWLNRLTKLSAAKLHKYYHFSAKPSNCANPFGQNIPCSFYLRQLQASHNKASWKVHEGTSYLLSKQLSHEASNERDNWLDEWTPLTKYMLFRYNTIQYWAPALRANTALHVKPWQQLALSTHEHKETGPSH